MYVYMVSENSGTPISHPKCWSFSEGNPMGQLGKPSILGKHPYTRIFDTYMPSIPKSPHLEKNSENQRPAGAAVSGGQ